MSNDRIEWTLVTDIGRWVGFGFGLAIIVTTWRSIISTFVLPRAITSRITCTSWIATRWLFLARANRTANYERKDKILALLGPTALLDTLVVWMLCFLAGFALLFWPLVDGGPRQALKLAGSSFFTLGVVSSPRGGPTIVEFIAAATGMIVVALQIGYLPTLYGAYNRRETLVVALNARAGTPTWGPELLARHQLNNAVSTLSPLYAQWEVWAADITESHVSHPWLMAFRSTDPLQSWIISLLAVLDSAALWISLAPSTAPPEARQCLHAGCVAMRTLGGLTGGVGGEPPDSSQIHLPFPSFLRGVEIVTEAGFPTEVGGAEAWGLFSRWRIQYEASAFDRRLLRGRARPLVRPAHEHVRRRDPRRHRPTSGLHHPGHRRRRPAGCGVCGRGDRRRRPHHRAVSGRRSCSGDRGHATEAFVLRDDG